MPLFRRFARSSVRPIAKPAKLRMETLEAREVPAIDLLSIANSEFPSNKPLFVPVTAASSDGPVSYTVTSSNSAKVSAEVVTGGRSLVFTVSGKDSSNTEFTGSFTLRLFEDVAPLATGNIINLVKAGYYNGKEFHRVVNDFVIQGGSPNGDGQGGSSLVSDVRDEYNPQYTFASRGIVAMANAGDDNNNAQFFITDPFIVSGGNEVDAPLDRRSQFLNFNHSIVGILTSGFDTYQKVMNVPKQLGSDGAVSSPVNDVKITNVVIDDNPRDGVLKLTALSGFLGDATITVTGTQSGNVDSETKTFTVTSVADTVNDRPFLGTIASVNTTKNTAIDFTLPFTELDSGDTPTFVVGRVVNTANGPVFTTLDPAQGTASVNQDGRVTFTPASGFTGTLEVTVGVRDAQDRIGSSLGLNDARNFDTEKLTVNVTGGTTANQAPTISDAFDKRANIGTTVTNTVAIGDDKTALNDLTVTATTNNATLFPAANVSVTGTGATRTITAIPAAGQTGTALVTVTVRDAGNLTATDTYSITIIDPGAPATVTLTGSSKTVETGREVVFTANVSSGTGNVQFFDGTTALGTVPVIDGKAILTRAFSSEGDRSITAKFQPTTGSEVTSNAVALDVNAASSPFVTITAEGQAAGTTSKVRILNQDGSLRHTVDPYPNFKGVIRVKVGDVNGDGQDDVVCTPGFGGGPLIVVYNGNTGALLFQRMIFEDFFRGGLNLDVGDAKSLGYDQILVGAGPTGGPRVTLLDAKNNSVLLNYFAYEDTNRGGVTVAISDLRGGNQANIITGAGSGISPTVKVFNPYITSKFEFPRLFGSFLAGPETDKTGIRIGTGPLINENRRDILVGPLDLNDRGELSLAYNPIDKGVFVG